MAPILSFFSSDLCIWGPLGRALSSLVSLQIWTNWGFSSQWIPEGPCWREMGRRDTKKDVEMTLQWGPGAPKLLLFVCRLHVSFLFGCLGFCWFYFCFLSMILVISVFSSFSLVICMLPSITRENWGPEERPSILQILFAVSDLFLFLLGVFYFFTEWYGNCVPGLQNCSCAIVVCMFHLCLLG